MEIISCYAGYFVLSRDVHYRSRSLYVFLFLLLWGSPVFLFFNVSIKCPERLESFGVESPWAHGVSPLPLPAWRPWLQRRPKKCSTFPIRWHVTWWFASIASRTFSLISLRAVATHWSWRMLLKVNLDLTWLASLFFWSYGHDMFLTKQKIKRTKSEECGWTETKAMSFFFRKASLKMHLNKSTVHQWSSMYTIWKTLKRLPSKLISANFSCFATAVATGPRAFWERWKLNLF